MNYSQTVHVSNQVTQRNEVSRVNGNNFTCTSETQISLTWEERLTDLNVIETEDTCFLLHVLWEVTDIFVRKTQAGRQTCYLFFSQHKLCEPKKENTLKSDFLDVHRHLALVSVFH